MTAGNYNVSIDRGFDWMLTLTWKDPNGNPYDLTGYSAAMKIRPAYADQTSVVYASLSSIGPSPEITLGGSAGTITLSLTGAATAAILPGSSVYDLRLTSPSGATTKLLEGIVSVTDEVTDQ